MQRYQTLSDNDIQLIHENSLRILEEVGVVFQYEPALEVFRSHGARVDGQTVYIPQELFYGSLDQDAIPAYSAVRFRIQLVAIYPSGTDVPAWK